jgi:hypothetical protein
MEARGLLAVAGLSALVLSACGGGDGMMTSGTPMPTATSPPMNPMPPTNPMNPMYPMSVPGEAAIGAFLQRRHESLLRAADGAAAIVVSAPAAKQMTFDGFAAAYAATRTLTVRGADQQLVTSTMTRVFLANPYVLLAKVGAGGSPVGVVDVSFGVPTTLRAGDSGAIDHLTYFHDRAAQLAEGAEVTTYTVEARDAVSLRLCLRSSVSEVTAQGARDGLVAGAESECFAITRAGAAALESVSTRDLILR